MSNDITPQEALGNALLEAHKLMPDKKLSEVQDIYLKFGTIEAGSAPETTVPNAHVVSGNGVVPKGEGVVENGES